jgi:hypothetical protein
MFAWREGLKSQRTLIRTATVVDGIQTGYFPMQITSVTVGGFSSENKSGTPSTDISVQFISEVTLERVVPNGSS